MPVRHFCACALALLLAVLIPYRVAHAGDILHEWPVGSYTSAPGETHDAFVLRVATALNAWAQEHREEACGQVSTLDAGGWTVALVTQHGQVACMPPTIAPPGATLTGETIHDHPTPKNADGYIVLTGYDHDLARAMGDKAGANRGLKWSHMEPNDFSSADYAAGPGYLVTGGRLLYQHGAGTAREVAALP